MNNTQLKTALLRFEGYKREVYLDSATPPNKTVGIGHMLTGQDALMPVGTDVSDQQIQNWFNLDVLLATSRAKQIVPSFDTLDDVRQQAVVTLTFNLGNRLSGFPHFLAAIQNKDWQEAANQLRNSQWATQVKTRCDETCDALVNGFWNF